MRLFIQRDNVTTKVKLSNYAEQGWLTRFLSFSDTSESFVRDGEKIKFTGVRQSDMLNMADESFPAGYTAVVARLAKAEGFEVEVFDDRKSQKAALGAPLGEDASDWLYDFQHDAVNRVLKRTRGILSLPTGSGKCLAPGTEVLMYSGVRRQVQDLRPGDVLMGPDSLPRTVQSTTRGQGPMCEITPKRGEAWRCNDVHVLCLKHTSTGDVVDVPLNEYASKGAGWRHTYKQWGATVNFPARDFDLDPYLVGLYVAAGYRDGATLGFRKLSYVAIPSVSRLFEPAGIVDPHGVLIDMQPGGDELTAQLSRIWATFAHRSTMAIDYKGGIPFLYQVGSSAQRKALLAGLVDGCGRRDRSWVILRLRSKQAADDAAFVCRTLGFRAKVTDEAGVFSVKVYGDLSDVPIVTPRKQPTKPSSTRSPTMTAFDVQNVGTGEYYGFTLDGDGRFLLGDCTVTHNTEVLCGLMLRTPRVRWLVIAPEADLMLNAAERWERRQESVAGRLGDSKETNLDARIVCATDRTLSLRLQERTTRNKMVKFLRQFTGVIFDECHQSSADGAWLVLDNMTNALYRCGLSGTALARGDSRNMYTMASFGEVIYRIEPRVLMDRKFIAEPTIHMIPTMIKPVRGKTYNTQYKQGITANHRRNATIAKIAAKAAKPCLIRVKHKNHGNELLALLKAAGHNVAFVHGQHKTEQRERVIQDLREGNLDIAIASKVWQTGTDIPELLSVIMAQGGKSAIETIQSVGRGLRVVRDTDGNIVKDKVDIYDFSDFDAKIRNPATNRMIGSNSKIFNKHSRARVAHYVANGYAVVVLEPEDCLRYGISPSEL